ncbi:hypothetical protein [Polaromonas sp. DSR2-3-2]|uniref:hypothetical protein n=1 Tax=unclassified Polaromonas TaxID=2638319 RepID=UPI003CF6D59B
MKRSWNALRDNGAGAWPLRTSVIAPVYARRALPAPGLDFVLQRLRIFPMNWEKMHGERLLRNNCGCCQLLKKEWPLFLADMKRPAPPRAKAQPCRFFQDAGLANTRNRKAVGQPL